MLNVIAARHGVSSQAKSETKPSIMTVLHFLLAAIVAVPAVAGATTAADPELQIVPGASWTATNTGEHLQAHGTGAILVDGLYYIVGENKTDGALFQNVNCYSSPDLVEWTFVNAPLTVQASGDLGPDRIVERPKVIYNDNTQQYVMYMHIDNTDYSEAKVGVATSDTVCGDYNYLGSWQPLGYQSRDMGLFKDINGDGYLLTEDRENGLRIDKLSEDYLNVTQATVLFSEDLEAPAMIYHDGLYYVFASHLTGWNTNDNVYATATSVAGPWSEWADFADPGTNTYNSQTAFVLQTASGPMYMGDRWDPNDFIMCTYVWLPLTLNGTTAYMPNEVSWSPDTRKAGPSTSNYNGASGTYSNGARTVSCSGCASGQAAGWLGGPSQGTLVLSDISSTDNEEKTIMINYENGDSTQRFALVTVNDAPAQRVAFIPTGGGDTPGVAVMETTLNSGSGNTITITGLGDGSYAPDIDSVEIPEF